MATFQARQIICKSAVVSERSKKWPRVALSLIGLTVSLAPAPGGAATLTYDSFDAPGGYALSDYEAKWSNPYGLGEMAVTDTRDFSGGKFSISAAPFKTGYDFGVYDHIKYLGVSTQSFAVPNSGSLSFSATIQAASVGTDPGRVINGTYVQSGLPYAGVTSEAQQASAVMNMIDFQTGQLFDWFISGHTAFTLIERLPSAVTNPGLPSSDPSYVGIDKMYTQMINVVDIGPRPHEATITYDHSGGSSGVSYFLDGVLVSQVGNVGIPLDKQGVPYAGIYPSDGAGESLANDIHSFSIGQGLFSLLDAFPFQLPDRPDLSVSIPVSNRIFGQGISANFDDFTVTTATIAEPASWPLMLAGLGVMGIFGRRRATVAIG